MSEKEHSRHLPFSFVWPLLAGVFAGLLLRLTFSGTLGKGFETMSVGLALLSPVVIGAVTVYVAERRARRSWGYYVWASFTAALLCMVGALLLYLEGLICIVLIAPLFAALGVAGGLLMGVICRALRNRTESLCMIILLPFVAGGVERSQETPARLISIERSVLVDAPRERIWNELLTTRNVRPDEMASAFLFSLGAPLPLEGITRSTEDGLVRRVHMGRMVYFDEVIEERIEPAHIRWTYRFYDDSFPPGTLDEHVVIGGDYFDIVDTSYRLRPRQGLTEMTIEIRYRVTTSFNWYAVPLSRLLIGDLARANIRYYQHRSEGLPALPSS